jgi:lysozyme family protein
MTTDDVIDDILSREGGFVDHANDHGGPTNKGITLATLSDWRGRPCAVDDLKALTDNEARDIYRNLYIHRPRISAIANPVVMALLADISVNSGQREAVTLLQRALGIKEDGRLGPVTEQTANAMNSNKLYIRLCAERVRLYGKIINHDHSQAVFAEGWLNRAAEFIEAAA